MCGDRIAMLGLSFGTSVALGMAVYSPVIKVLKTNLLHRGHTPPVNAMKHFI